MADTATTPATDTAASASDSTIASSSATIPDPSASTVVSSTSTSEPSPAISSTSSDVSTSASADTASASASSLISQVSSSVGLSSTSQYGTLSASVLTSATTTGLTSSTATSKPSSNGGLSSGTKVAIALVCVGVFFGALLGFYLIRRDLRRRRRAAKSRRDISGASPSTVVALPFTVPRDSPSTHASELDKYLAVPKADRELASGLQSLGHLVQQHVEDHYHGEPKFTSTGLISQSLVDLGLDEDTESMPGAARLASMAANPSIRHATLQHIIIRVTFKSLTMDANCKTSLLPSAIMDLIRAIPPVENHVGNAEALSSALNRWRQLSVFLLNAKRSERGVLRPDEDVLRAKAKVLVASLNKFLEAFVPKEGRTEQENHLEDVVVECAKFGYAVLSQPAEIAWQFEAGKQDGTHIVICPGLEKIRDNYGVVCEAAQIVAPELQKI